MTIVSSPDRVCLEHAVEFWTGLLAYTRGRSGPCVKQDMVCVCSLCEELTASQLRTFAIASADSSPADHADFPVRLAS